MNEPPRSKKRTIMMMELSGRQRLLWKSIILSCLIVAHSLQPSPPSSSTNSNSINNGNNNQKLHQPHRRQHNNNLLELSYAAETVVPEHKQRASSSSSSSLKPFLSPRVRLPKKKSLASKQKRGGGGSSNNNNMEVGLTREQEIEFSFRIRTFRAAMKLRDSLVRTRSCTSSTFHNLHTPTEPEWAEACGTTMEELRRIVHEGQEARAALVAANVGLVTSVAKRYHQTVKHALQANGGVGTILTMQDMIQEGNLGLMEAAERYEPEKGFRFSTYATYWVRQRILRSINDTSRTIRLPEHVHTTLSKISKAKREIKVLLGRDPADEEVAQHLEMSVDKLRKYASSSRNVLSLESPLRSASSKEDTRTLADTLASDAPTPEEDTEADLLRGAIEFVMNTELGEDERKVIAQRFGLNDCYGKPPRTVMETGKLLGLSPDRVRSLEARALNKLRHPQRNYRLKEYVDDDDDEEEGSKSKESPEESSRPERIWFF